MRKRLSGAILGACVMASVSTPLAARDLVIGLNGNINTLDPHKTTTVGLDLSVISHLYLSMVSRGPDMKLAPGLAESWTAVDDTTWRFELKPGIAFANGEPLDAEAVKWNIERILDPETGARNRPFYASIVDVRVVGPTTIEFVSSKPFPDLPSQMTMLYFLPPRWAQENNPAITAMPSGPYRLVEFASGDRVTLEANPGYAGPDVEFENVEFRVLPEDASRIAALMAGDVDFITGFPPSEMARINAADGVEASAVGSTRSMMLKFNTLTAPLKDNPKIWQALNYAVDKQGISDALFDGLATLSNCQMITPDYFGYNPDLKPIPYDPEKARALLEEAGVGDTLALELEVPMGRFVLSSDIGQLIAMMFEDVGITVTIREMEYGSWMEKYLVQRNLGQTSYMGLSWPTLDAGGVYVFMEQGTPHASYENPAVQDLIVAARSTTDPTRREELYREITTKLCEEPPMVYLFEQPIIYAQRDAIEWQARGDDFLRAMDMTPQD